MMRQSIGWFLVGLPAWVGLGICFWINWRYALAGVVAFVILFGSLLLGLHLIGGYGI
jgi:hypothetical protein